jgi:hypothetical protein
MSDIEDILESKTNKNDGLSNAERILYTLTDVKELEIHRTAKLLSILIADHIEKGTLSESELDEMLLELV